MRVCVLGTGIVGKSHSARLTELGHEVAMGTRDVSASLASSKKDIAGGPPIKDWLEQNPRVRLGTFPEAARHGEIVINAVNGQHALEALRLAGEMNLRGKVMLDITNPLDFSRGMPPSLTVSNTDSLGEQIQRAFPDTKVVKTLNTVNALLQVEPRKLMDGDHNAFVSGNDGEAKNTVIRILKDYGWRDIIDLGDITTARGPEQVLPIWVRLLSLKGPMFNFKVVTQ